MELTLEQLRAPKIGPLCALLNSGAERKPHKGRKGFDMTWEEHAELQLSISRFGICGRVIIDADTGEVLDGWNTLQCHWAAVDAGAAKPEDILPHIEYKKFTSPREEAEFPLAPGEGRRNVEAALDQTAAGERARPIPSPPPIEPRPEASAADPAAELEALQALWARVSDVARDVFARLIFDDVTKRAASPEQLQSLAQLYPPEPPAHYGVAGNVALMMQSDRVKRKTRDADTLDLCGMVESAVRERRAVASGR